MSNQKSKVSVEITSYELIDYPSKEFDEIQSKLNAIYRICEPEDSKETDYVLKPPIKCKLLIAKNMKEFLGYLVITHTDDYNEFGSKIYNSESELINSFVERGGIQGKDGYFLTSFCTNIKKYKGVGTKMLNYYFKIIEKNVDYSFLHVSPKRHYVVKFYKKYGFNIVRTFKDDFEELYVMRRHRILNNIIKEYKGYCYIRLYDRNQLLYERSKGYPWKGDSQHRIGSVTKSFCAFAIVLLIQMKKLNLDDTIDMFGLLKRIPNSNKITIRHLLSHKSGIYDASYDHYYRDFDYEWDHDPRDIKPLKFKEMIKEIVKHKDCIQKQPPKRPWAKNEECFLPGEKYFYSNTGYYLLAYVIEYVSKMDPRLFLKRFIFDPLRMNDTTFHLLKAPNKVDIFQQNGKDGHYENHGKYGLNGNTISSMNDLHKFMLKSKDLLSKENHEIWKSFIRSENGITTHSGEVDYDDVFYNVSKTQIHSNGKKHIIFMSNRSPHDSGNLWNDLINVLHETKSSILNEMINQVSSYIKFKEHYTLNSINQLVSYKSVLTSIKNGGDINSLHRFLTKITLYEPPSKKKATWIIKRFIRLMNKIYEDFVPYSINKEWEVTIKKNQKVRNCATLYVILKLQKLIGGFSEQVMKNVKKDMDYYIELYESHNRPMRQASAFLGLAIKEYREMDRHIDKKYFKILQKICEYQIKSLPKLERKFELGEVLIFLKEGCPPNYNLLLSEQQKMHSEIENDELERKHVFKYNWHAKYLFSLHSGTGYIPELRRPTELEKSVESHARFLADKLKKTVNRFVLEDVETNYLAVCFEACSALTMIDKNPFISINQDLMPTIGKLFGELDSRINDGGLFRFLSGGSRIDITGHVIEGLLYLFY